MKIKKLDLFKVPPRWVFLKITTDSGLSGWGEPIIEGKAETVIAAVKEMEPYLIGKNAMDIEDIWQMLYRGAFYRGGPILMSAISGIDQALWDLKGKFLNVPIYELLGGAVRNKMKVYGWIGGDNASLLITEAENRIQQGFKAIKLNVCGKIEWIDTLSFVMEAVNNIISLRHKIGKDIGIGIDFHGRIHKGLAKLFLKELDAIHPMFIEEPVPIENYEALTYLNRYTSAPIATGERMFSRWDFKRVFETGIVDIIQPDLSHAGGISEVKRIAAMAEAYDIALAPHCPLGPISLAAALQVDFSCINAFIQETSIGIHYNKGVDLLDYISNPEIFAIRDGFIKKPDLPGLGIIINEKKVEEMSAIAKNWKNPVWRYNDGSIAEW